MWGGGGGGGGGGTVLKYACNNQCPHRDRRAGIRTFVSSGVENML